MKISQNIKKHSEMKDREQGNMFIKEQQTSDLMDCNIE